MWRILGFCFIMFPCWLCLCFVILIVLYFPLKFDVHLEIKACKCRTTFSEEGDEDAMQADCVPNDCLACCCRWILWL